MCCFTSYFTVSLLLRAPIVSYFTCRNEDSEENKCVDKYHQYHEHIFEYSIIEDDSSCLVMNFSRKDEIQAGSLHLNGHSRC